MNRTRDWKKYLSVSTRNAIRAISENNNAPLGKKLRYAGAIERSADADEPQDFDDRNVLTQDGYAITEDLLGPNVEDDDTEVEDVEDSEEWYAIDDEPRSTRAHFTSLSTREQNRMIDRCKAGLCEKLGIAICDWEPSDALILDAIEGDISNDMLVQLVYAEYLATPQPPEGNPSDEEAPPSMSHDQYAIGQGSREWGLPNIGRRNLSDQLVRCDNRRGPRTMKGRRPESGHVINLESHCPKHGRQDYRQQLPRMLEKAERHMAMYDAMSERMMIEWSESFPKLKQEPPTYLSVKEQIFMISRVEHMNEWLFDLVMEKFEREFDEKYPLYRRHNPFLASRTVYANSLFDLAGDYNTFMHLDDDGSWDWPEAEDEQSPFPDSWFDEDLYSDIFADYGNTDRDVDARHIGYSSRLRFTGRYRLTRRMVTNIARLLA